MRIVPPTPIKKVVNDNLVFVLMDLLERAQEGEFVGVVGVATFNDGDVATFKCIGEEKDFNSVLGMLSRLQHDLCMHMNLLDEDTLTAQHLPENE